MKTNCAITQDLLPLYEEGLLSPDTQQFIDTHLQSCEECRDIAAKSQIPLPTKAVPHAPNKKMIRKITVRVTSIQLIFMAIAFILAISSAIINDNRSYILTYTLLGLATYLFYRSTWITLFIAAVPTVACSCLLYMTDWIAHYYVTDMVEAVQLVLFSLVAHLIFTLCGIAIGFCIRKVMEEKS